MAKPIIETTPHKMLKNNVPRQISHVLSRSMVNTRKIRETTEHFDRQSINMHRISEAKKLCEENKM